MDDVKDLKDFVNEIKKEMRCNCDLDNWQPEPSTGHSHVCRIHKKAIMLNNQQQEKLINELLARLRTNP